VLERIDGIKIDDVEALATAGYDRHHIALQAARMLIKEMLEDGFFHADPHPGNFVIMPGEVIGVMDFGMVGYLGQRERADLIQLYVVVVQLNEEGIVDQLIRMGTAAGQVDRAGLRRDVARLLHKYYGLPLKEIHAQEVIEEIMPIGFRHHLHLPSEYWLLGKTLAMMEGVALKLDPNFDIFAAFKPHIGHFMRQQFSPRTLGENVLRGGQEWSNLVLTLPRRLSHLLDDANTGNLSVNLRLPEIPDAMTRLDRIANRLSVSILLAALIIGLATLVPAFNLVEQWGLGIALIFVSFVGTSLLSLWLIFSIWRSGSRS
jgi:ubiquinone biosynthesis protein